jgi:hypothetical protein
MNTPKLNLDETEFSIKRFLRIRHCVKMLTFAFVEFHNIRVNANAPSRGPGLPQLKVISPFILLSSWLQE